MNVNRVFTFGQFQKNVY